MTPRGYPVPRPWGSALTLNWRNVDRLHDWRQSATCKRHPGVPRFLHYGPITGLDLFVACAVFRGSAYRAGDATRRDGFRRDHRATSVPEIGA